VIFQHDRLVGLIDFDDTNHTYLTFDLVCLIDYWAWPFELEDLDLHQAGEIIREYEKYRPLSSIERHHLFDVHKLSILFDCVWYFSRCSGDSFYERKKIGFMDTLGRDRYEDALFSD